MSKPSFSVVLIARNESATLPHLVESLTQFLQRGGEIILVDTGSTDQTANIARALGCKVFEEGERFRRTITVDEARKINFRFVEGNEPEILKAGDTLFDYTRARNYAAQLASNNMVAMPDCDERYTSLDLDKINEAIAQGVEQLEYNFVFSHDAFGNEAIKFMHSKFYDRTKMKWVGVVHEVLQGEAVSKFFQEDVIKLEHWQNLETNRGGYLRGLAVDCFENPNNDRNSHYFGRDLFWSGRPRSAIREFNRHIEMNKWPAERAQSMIFIGDALIQLGQVEEGLQSYHRAFLTDGSRREALIRLAHYMMGKKDWQRAVAYAQGALSIPLHGFYANRMEEYREVPHWMLYQALCHLGRAEDGRPHWRQALSYQPHNSTFLHDTRFFLNLPKVSIVIPTLGREEQLQKLKALLDDASYVNYPPEAYEVIIERDNFVDRKGVAKTLKAGVARATGSLICFLGNDCVPQKDFLIHAVLWHHDQFHGALGLVALNDGLWEGTLATHWLADKALADTCLDGEFFHTGYEHVGCDNELTARCLKNVAYTYCPSARLNHPRPGETQDQVSKLAWDPEAVARDRQLLAKRSRELGFKLL